MINWCKAYQKKHLELQLQNLLEKKNYIHFESDQKKYEGQ